MGDGQGQTTGAPHPLAPEFRPQTLETSQQGRGSAPMRVDWDGEAAVDEPGSPPLPGGNFGSLIAG